MPSLPNVAAKPNENLPVAEVVLDASAVIALLRRETGSDVVASALPGALISTVNLSEVAVWLSDAGVEDDAVRQTLDALMLDPRAFDSETAFSSARLRKTTRKKGLSLGDRACLALASHLKLPALTADRVWTELDIDVDVVLIR